MYGKMIKMPLKLKTYASVTLQKLRNISSYYVHIPGRIYKKRGGD